MNAKADFNNRSWKASNKPKPAQPIIIRKIGLVAFLVAGLGFTAIAQNFYNLDFERASLVPIPGGYAGEVQIGPALPGWSVFTQAPFVLYDTMFLDSAGVSLLDTGAFQGSFTVLLQGGFSLYSGPPDRVSSAIAQTGVIPAWAKSLLFDAWTDTGETNFAVSIAGENMPFYALASYSNYILYASDLSRFSGQTAEIRFAAYPNPPPGLAINNVYLDDIRFSSSPLIAPPLILTPPASQWAHLGSTVDLKVYATGYPAPAYQWFFNGTNAITGATSSILELTNLQASQFGAYTVVLTNVFGVATSPPAILISDPSILVQPQGQFVDAGQTTSFSVQAGGTCPLSYQWLKDAGALNNSGNVSGAQTATLTLSNILGGDAGGYSVIVSNGYGTVTSQVATLTVQDPVITSQPLSQSVGAGGTISFTVRAAGSPPLGYQWFFNGAALPGATSSNLQLTNIQSWQSGAYSVVVTSGFGTATSAPALLSVFPRLSYTVLHNFTGSDGASPSAILALSNGTLYGTTVQGGLCNWGTVFKVNTNGSAFALLKSFCGDSDSSLPYGGLALSGATLYGTTGGGGGYPDYGSVFKMNADGSGYSVLHHFSDSDGRQPEYTLLLSGSTLFGTTFMGGSSGYGTVFKIGTDGSGFTVLKQFAGSDGSFPASDLVSSGTTLYGGALRVGSSGGVVFGMNTDGTAYRVVKEFTGGDGACPSGRFVLSDAVLYGTTRYGGTSESGTVFKVNTDGTGFSVLKTFTTNDAGVDPCGGLVLAGTTLYVPLAQGGDSVYGAVFKINTDGSDYLVLKRFTGGSDGANPYGGLVLSGTTLYGTAQGGGSANCGVVFALSLPIPNVLTPPMSQTAEIGSSAAFTVGAENDPSMIYQWFFNGTNVISAATTNSYLDLTNVQPAQAGAYTIVVSNSFGAVTSAPAMLSVIPVVERRVVPALTLMGQPGSSLNLQNADTLGPSPPWAPFDSVVLANTSRWYFDVSAPLPPQRFYRAWQSNTPGLASTLDLHVVPALTLTGIVGSSVRVDCIHQVGPIDAWATLDTVTLTNTSQLYFDVSSIGQPQRLWRLVPVP